MGDSHLSVVIPTRHETVRTTESVPDGVETIIVREGTRAHARNVGAERASGDVLAFLDDDIAFPEGTLRMIADRLEPGTVAGLRDYDFGLLLTRLLVIHRADFEHLGGFDGAMNHMEDTEFSLRAMDGGLDLQRLPRETVEHADHESVGQGRAAIVTNTARLCARYPWAIPRLVGGLTGLREPEVDTPDETLRTPASIQS